MLLSNQRFEKEHKKIFRTECLLEDGLLFKLRENDNGSMRHKCKSKS